MTVRDRRLTLAAAIALVSVAAAWEPTGRVMRVKMVDVSPTEFAFSPAELTVRPGDVLQFVQGGVAPHNVEFRGPAAGALGEAQMGPYLVAKGQTYEIVIDERFTPGEYPFVCTPHESMGMKGTLIVAGPDGG